MPGGVRLADRHDVPPYVRRGSGGSRRALFLAAALCAAALPAAAADPLPSWNETRTKQSIFAFVERVTTEGSRDFVPIADRVAVFDDDGTLWAEQPVAEVAFATARLKKLAEKDPSLRERQPFKAALEGDVEWLRQAGPGAAAQILSATHGGLSAEEFQAEAREFFQSAKHPKLGAPWAALAYQPMLELLRYLRANGFQTWICSGTDADFIRAISEEVFGVPPQQVIGSDMEKQWSGNGELRRTGRLARLNDKAGKVVGIDLHIGRRPIFAAGNARSAGDAEMLRYAGQRGGSFALVIDHDDAEREVAYPEQSGAAQAGSWAVASMKRDWATVFAPRNGAAVSIAYVKPADPELRPLYENLVRWKVLEELGQAIAFIHLPGALTLKTEQCGSANTYYDSEEHSVIFCYELLDELDQDVPDAVAQGLSRQDALVGSVVFLFLHEIGHAVFDLLHVPILGHEEDAADQFAAYVLLRGGSDFAGSLLAGAAWMYAHGASAHPPDESDFSDVHALDSQRYYSVLCLAYGRDAQRYAMVAGGRRLPADRAGGCADEFNQLQAAMEQLIAPHADVRELERLKAARHMQPRR